MGRHHRHKHKGTSGPTNGRVLQLPSGGEYTPGRLGAFSRSYPPRHARDTAITAIKALPEEARSGDQWWMLGEYQIFNGLLDEDEGLINDGIAALTSGVALPKPSVACLLDLGWILTSRGLDALALPYLKRASEIEPNSRDIFALRAVAEIGVGNREAALSSLTRAAVLPNATDGDRQWIEDIQNESDLKEMRKRVLLAKIHDGDPDLTDHPPVEQARAAAYVLKSIYDRNPGDMGVAYGLAYARYCSGQLVQAKPLLDSVVANQPDNSEAWTLLGLIAKKTDNPEVEIAMYRQALAADPRCVLANVNLASRVMDEDARLARGYLEIALADMDHDNPHRAAALDLMGNTYAHLEKDYAREGEFHRQALALSPNTALYRDNLILSLLSAGRPIDARSVWQGSKNLPSQHPVVTEDGIRAFWDETQHPYVYLQFIDVVRHCIGEPGIRLLLRRAWKRRSHVPPVERLEFLTNFATFASQAGDCELALLAWREAAPLDGSGVVTINEAVALDQLGQHSQALTLMESLNPAGDRFHTVLGNIRMNVGLLGAATEAYRIAVETEPAFILPFSNAFDCIDRLREPFLVEPFIRRLEDRWPESPQRTLLLARANLLSGRPKTAARLFAELLIEDDRIVSPEDLFKKVHDPTDLTLFVSPRTDAHLDYADALLRSRNLATLRELTTAIFAWPRWSNGDWRVINAENVRLGGGSDQVSGLLDGMADQAPAQISNALALLEISGGSGSDSAPASRDNILIAVETIANGVAKNIGAEYQRHPEGRPDSLAYALLSVVHRERSELGQARECGSEAVRRDPGCLNARCALVSALSDLGERDEAVAILLDGLRRLPSEPRMLRLAVETLVEFDLIAEADTCLSANRVGLTEYGDDTMGYRLGELVAEAKLSQLPPTQSRRVAALENWPWLPSLDPVLQGWMANAHHCLGEIDELGVALAMYAGKVAEKLLVDHLMAPFKQSLRQDVPFDAKFKDTCGFLTGGRPPALGGIVHLLRCAQRGQQNIDVDVLKTFRSFVRSASWPGCRMLSDRNFIERLQRLASVRNESAHVNEPGRDAIVEAMSIVVDKDAPGALFLALGFTFHEGAH